MMMNMQITDGCRVTVRCRVTDSAGEVLDEGDQPLVFVCGRQQLIRSLEQELRAKQTGYHGRVDLTADEAYGPYRQELVFEAVRENLPAELDIQPGMVLSPGGGAGKFGLKVLALTGRGAILDGNHRFAGKHLSFEVEVIDVEAATEPCDASS